MRKILVLDPERCTGCNTCAVVCSFGKEKEFNIHKSRISVIDIEPGVHAPMVCQHCATPLCEDVCPMGAISKDEQTGTVLVNSNLCIGCQMCLIVCPLGGPAFNIETGAMMKCDLCEGDPLCAKYCFPGALKFVDADQVALIKRREGAEKLSVLIRKVIE